MEDGREIFDDVDDDYEVQENSKKRKSLQNKKKGKLPDEPAAKKKSLKNFFSTRETKEAASVEDDNLLKNILGELDESVAPSETSSNTIAPIPIKSIRKQANEKEIEMKKYMEKFGKKDKEVKKDVDGEVRNYF